MAGFWSRLDYWQTLIAGAFTRDSALDHWQMLIAAVIGGVLALIAGIVAYVGARHSAKAQVAAVEAQIVDLWTERKRTDDRRLSVVKWAVRAEGKRIEQATAAVGLVLPPEMYIGGVAGFSDCDREQLTIPSSSLLRGEREDIALLDSVTLTNLEDIANALNDYNSRIEAARPRRVQGSASGVFIGREVLTSLAKLAEQAKLL